jgi:hypothetical protein
VKLLFRFRAALALLAPLALVLAIMVLPWGCGGGGGSSAASPTATQGFVEVGFTDSAASGFQHILLNVVSVRINPSSDPDLSEFDPNWRTISPPAGPGAQGEVQIDLNAVQDQVQLLTTASLAAQTYRLVELQLDPNVPGLIVPNCPQAPATNEGCLSYPFLLLKPGTAIRAGAALAVQPNSLAPLVVDINPGQITPPVTTNLEYIIDPSISIPRAASLLGTITGSVSGVPSQGAVVKANLSGTDQFAASAPVISGSYTLELPAASTFGTAYDVVVTGNGVVYSGAFGVLVERGKLSRQNFTTAGTSTGFVNGQITDNNTGFPIDAATIDLLIPPANAQGTNCALTPSKCVVAAVANTDDAGNYPLPGNVFGVPPFDIVPLGVYTLRISASGYDTRLVTAPLSSAGATAVCGGTLNTSNCSFALASNSITGMVSIDVPPPAGSSVQVLVAAEDTGTNTMENVTMTTIQGTTSAPFTLRVPKTVGNFDLIASAQDFLGGRPSSFPGHEIEVLADVPPGAAGQNFPVMTCAGHGSVSGVAGSPDSQTTVILSKGPVQLMQSMVAPSLTTNAGAFSFCAPPDTYTVQRFENGTPVGTPLPVTVASPAAIATPCPRFCSFPNGACPNLCRPTTLSSQL